MAADKQIEAGTDVCIRYNADGLIPAIVQDVDSGAVLMMAWMNDEALVYTLKHRKAAFYSRSRGTFWVKGESSGHVQQVVEARVDCDQDVVLLRVKSLGPACHVGYATCFYRAFEADGDTLAFVEEKVFDPEQVYAKKP